MPYIIKKQRQYLDPALETLIVRLIETDAVKGNLNYVVSRLAWACAKHNGGGYDGISEAIGALRDAAEELRRRKLDPYEDIKIKINGDVFD